MGDEICDVMNFHDKFGIPVPDSPALLTKQKLVERANFMLEELIEFAAAAGVIMVGGKFIDLEGAEQDLPGQADALIDLVYVAKGTAVQLGLPWDALWDDVHAVNMTKVRGTSDRAHIDVIKPPGWRGPATAKILQRYGWGK